MKRKIIIIQLIWLLSLPGFSMEGDKTLIRLRVRDKEFRLPLKKLADQCGYFKDLLAKEWPVGVLEGAEIYVTLYRNPTSLEIIWDYIEYGQLFPCEDERIMSLVKEDAEFLKMPELSKLIEEHEKTLWKEKSRSKSFS